MGENGTLEGGKSIGPCVLGDGTIALGAGDIREGGLTG